jgi:hypothetical protein
MRSVREAVGFFLGVFLCGAVSAGGDLVIGHVPVRLGMSQTEALAALGKEFDVNQVSIAEGKYLLWTREPETKTSYSAGAVSFRNGKLYRASRTWATAGIKNLNESATGLFGALSNVGCQGGTSCTVKAETLKTPANARNGEDMDLVTINAPPDRKVVVKIRKPHAGCDPVLHCEWEVEESLMETAAAP